ncbi:MAG TPA: hypothetical protein VGO93_29900 [Candidatus Xenobia bacterium]|jgi:uncharacterized protein (DUF433 family)/DNA-binding transcriptional MerR regulator
MAAWNDAGQEVIAAMVDALHVDAYEPSFVARLTHLQPRRVRLWLKGGDVLVTRRGERRVYHIAPVVSEGGPGGGASFLDLVEVRFISELLRHGVSLQSIRRAYLDARARFGDDHPFARLRFFTFGKSIMVKEPHKGPDEDFIELLTGGQLAMGPIIERFGREVNYGKSLASEWWPLTKERAVVIDPVHAFGAPTVAGRNLKTANVYDLYLGEGRDITAVCRYYGLTEREVLDVVEFEESLQRKAA